VGDNKNIKIDVRVITATNEDLLKQMEENQFREDLYHRLNGFKLKLPALRERGEDILEFTNFFIQKANQGFSKNILGIDNSVKELFYQYPWFGNIRELQNIINRAVLLSQKDYITSEVLPDEIRLGNAFQVNKTQPAFLKNNTSTDLKEATEVTEKQVIVNALSESNNNKSKAAKMLNIDRKTLYNKIKLYEIEAMK
jgi:two-component system response regulator HydG